MNRKNRGSVTSITLLLGLAAIVLVAIGSYITNYNYGNRAEKEIVATWEDNENILGQYSLKVVEVAQVSTMYKDDVKEIFTATLAGRYGENGSQAMFQWLKEQNPEIDSAIYKKIQQIMEAGRNEFSVAQTRLVDQKRAYETNLGYLWKGMWLGFAGYPMIVLADYKIITSEHASEAFETGIDKGITLR